MKFTLSHLKKCLDTDKTNEEIIDKLFQLGFEVEEVINQADIYKSFIVAEIIDSTPHEKADKLKVCKVNNGKEILQIVCGAPNARAGIKVVLAPIGAKIPSNKLIIKESKIRDVLSYGMLCSAKELELDSDSDGILELDSSLNPGESFAKINGLDEVLIDISITPNRGDCLGVYGIARDLAASGIGKLKTLDTNIKPSTFDSPIDLKIQSPEICSKYIGRYFKNVKNGPSPDWLQHFLKSIGQKPISALVDITNYFTFFFGRPLHIYNADSIKEICVRKAEANEKFTALNDQEYFLTEGDFVLSDGKKIIGLPGIIGEKTTGVYLDTTNIFLEIAMFDSDLVSQISRKHQIDTDAKYRFERKLDPDFLNTALSLASEMIEELCGGEGSKPVIADFNQNELNKIEFNLDLFERKLGISYSEARIKEILLALGFKITKYNDIFEAIVPSWRNDIRIKEDLVEEIARIDGFHNIPTIPLNTENVPYPILDSKQSNFYKIQRFIASLGLDEVVTWSFMNSKKCALFSELRRECYIKNPISSELDYMRPSIIPNLLDVVQKNQNRNNYNLALYELASVFKGISPRDQILTLTGLRSGHNYKKNIYQDHRLVDVFDIKSDVVKILSELGFDLSKLQYQTDNLPKYYHPKRSTALTLGKNILCYFGEIHPKIIKAYELNATAVGFEIFLDNIPTLKLKYGRKGILEVSDYQMVKRDFAFIVKKEIAVDKIIKSVLNVDKKLIKEVDVFDIYQGKGIDTDKKSVAFTVSIQAHDHTLLDSEIELLSTEIIKTVIENTGGTLRSV